MALTGTEHTNDPSDLLDDVTETIEAVTGFVGDTIDSWLGRCEECKVDVMSAEDKCTLTVAETCRIHPDHTPTYNKVSMLFGEMLAALTEKYNKTEALASAGLKTNFGVAHDHLEGDQLVAALSGQPLRTTPQEEPNQTAYTGPPPEGPGFG